MQTLASRASCNNCALIARNTHVVPASCASALAAAGNEDPLSVHMQLCNCRYATTTQDNITPKSVSLLNPLRSLSLGQSRYVETEAIALGKARERRIRDESVKPFKEVQPVKVRSGQSLSRQTGSECGISSGDWRGEAYTARKQAARIQLRNRFIIATPTPLA
jgi:hypothetical protein